MTASATALAVDVREGIATLTLNRPEKRNALDGALVEALAEAVASTAVDPAVRVVVVRGAGPDFCSGADLAELEGLASASRDENLADARRLGDLLLALRHHPRPVVAAVRGRALAGGCGLVTACDLVLAEENARFGYPEVRLGFVPAMVMALLRRKVSEGRAFELVSMGRSISAGDAHRLGLVNQVLPAGGFDEAVDAYVSALAARPPSAVALTKALLYELDALDVEGGVARGVEVNVEARMSDACREGVRRFLEGRREHDA
jgi:methylglutaconyl-CoA hydratase